MINFRFIYNYADSNNKKINKKWTVGNKLKQDIVNSNSLGKSTYREIST